MGVQVDWRWKSRGCRSKPIRSQTGYGYSKYGFGDK